MMLANPPLGALATNRTDPGRIPLKAQLYLALTTFLAATAQAALPGDAAEGKRLHDAHCTSCHDSAVYVRKDRMVRSLEDLKTQVVGCGRVAKQTFSSEQVRDIVKYLNDQFYRFP